MLKRKYPGALTSRLDALAHRVEAKESALRRDLDRVRARVSKHQTLKRELAQARQHAAERDAELRQLRQQLTEREAQAPPADAGGSPATLTAFPPLDVPDGLHEGIALLTRQLDFVRRFARARAQRGNREVLTGFAEGLDLIHAHLCVPTTNLGELQRHADDVLPPTVLRWALLHDLLPAFDDLHRCVRTLRGSARSSLLDPLREAVEWVFACFVGVLERRSLSLRYPLGSSFNPHEHEASALVQTTALAPGSVAEVLQVGVWLDGTMVRPARVTVVAADMSDPLYEPSLLRPRVQSRHSQARIGQSSAFVTAPEFGGTLPEKNGDKITSRIGMSNVSVFSNWVAC